MPDPKASVVNLAHLTARTARTLVEDVKRDAASLPRRGPLTTHLQMAADQLTFALRELEREHGAKPEPGPVYIGASENEAAPAR